VFANKQLGEWKMKVLRRFFNKRERAALFLAADGKSEMSGEPLEENWHADHVVAWSKGGLTDMNNGQALNAIENIAKGASCDSVSLRSWQRQFVDQWRRSIAIDFMLAALPGGGKTRAALYCANEYLGGDAQRRLIVVVPTSNLREQWRDEAWDLFRVKLQTKEFRVTLRTEFQGVVTTYASVARMPALFRRLCAQHSCMVIFDEIHHAGDQSTWGVSIRDAFENAAKRLCLSGTPFKSDGQLIPFLWVGADGYYQIDFPYDYPSALRDGVVREVSFHRYAGSVTLAVGEEILEFHTADDLAQDAAARRLRGLLKSTTFTRGLLREAHEKLVSVRKAKPDAAALALCIDANHAVEVARLLFEITGEQPDIVVCDDDYATSSVKSFRESNRKWIVAVRMVSEGVDIRRLMVLAYLTNTTTELFFRQAIGRIMRSEATDFDTESYCYLPDDPRLTEHAAKIESFQAQVVAEQEEEGRRERDEVGASQRTPVEVLGASRAEFVGLTTRGTHKEKARSLEVLALAEEFGIEEAKMAAVLERLASRGPALAAHDPKEETVEEHPEDKLARLRRECSKLTNRLAVRIGAEPKDVHSEYKRLANISQDRMTVPQLERKRAWLLKRLADAPSR